MFVPTRSRSQMTEKSEGRSTAYVPMVYERVDQDPVHWEYHVLTVDTREQELPDADQLNELGRDGWILAGMVDLQRSGGSKVYFYFVRQAEK